MHFCLQLGPTANLARHIYCKRPISCTPGTWTGPALRKLNSICWHFAGLVATICTYFQKQQICPWSDITTTCYVFIFLFSNEILLYKCSDFGNTLIPLCPFLSDQNGSLVCLLSFRMQLNQFSTCSGLGFGDLAIRPGCAID